MFGSEVPRKTLDGEGLVTCGFKWSYVLTNHLRAGPSVPYIYWSQNHILLFCSSEDQRLGTFRETPNAEVNNTICIANQERCLFLSLAALSYFFHPYLASSIY